MRKITKQTIADGDLPEGNVVDGYSMYNIMKRMRYLDTYKTVWLEVKTKKF